jgi:YjbE family integral membrane protein
MPVLADAQFWTGLWQVIIADIILAGDNAVVIALAVRSLPERQQFWGRIFGAFGAVALRVAFVWLVSWLLQVPFLQLAGGVMLLWIAWKLVSQPPASEDEAHVKAGATLWQAVWVIVVADVVMSFDNVMAIAGASHGHMGLVIFGLLFSIPLVVMGSGLLSNLMKRFPVLIWLGAGLLGHVAGHMMLADIRVKAAVGPWLHTLENVLPIALAVIITLLGWWFSKAPAVTTAAPNPEAKPADSGVE